jgi:hypothetical protein
MHRISHRKCLAFALLIVLAASGASAGPLTQASPVQSISSFWSTLVCTFFGGETCAVGAIQAESDSGCILDPHGGACATQSAPLLVDSGCGLDPHGAACQ